MLPRILRTSALWGRACFGTGYRIAPDGELSCGEH